MNGVVSFYDWRRGWGFIDSQDLKRDVFFHCTELPEVDRRRHDLEGLSAVFSLGDHNGKQVAKNVRLVAISSEAIA